MEYPSQKNLFTKIKSENETTTKVSFWVSHLLAKQGKLFKNNELIKLCLTVATKEMHSEKINSFKTINHLVRTVV